MLANEIQGHPSKEIFLGPNEPPTLITVCAACGEIRSILFLCKDRWFCTKCRVEGAAPPSLYPIA